MAIISPLAGTGGISDGTINAMLQSGDPNLIKQANEYLDAKEKQAEERDTKGFLDFFGFGSAAAAEPDKGILGIQTDIPVNQFSVTQPQPSLFDFKRAQLFDPTNIMRGSVVEDVVDTPIREFGEQLVGREDQAIFGESTGQRYNVDNPELFFNTVAGQARATDDNNFFDYLKNLSGGIVDFAKDIGGSFLGGQTGAKAAAQFGISPLIGFGIGALKGTGLFDPVGKGMAPELQRGLYDEYGGDNLGRLTSGIMQGYNPRGGNLLISAVDRRQNILRNLKNPRARARGFTGRNLPALDKFIDDQVKAQTAYYGGTGATDVTGSSDYTSTGSPQSMGSARGGAGGRPY